MNGKTRKRKKAIYLRREKYKKVTKKRIILGLAIIIVTIVSGFIAKAKFDSDQEKIYTKAEVVEDSITTNGPMSEDNAEEVVDSPLDNGGYLPLEKDPNADDAIELEKVIKHKYPVRTDGKKVAYLTFDDGPSTTNTPNVLNILKENNIKATFMILGKNAEKSEEAKEILKRTVKEGHAIGNHTYSHDYDILYPLKGKFRYVNANNFMGEVDKCNEILKSILGKDFSTRVIRFPGGFTSWRGTESIKPLISEKGYASIDWHTETGDSEGKPKNADELVSNFKINLDALGKNADSVVLLMHDTYKKEETVKALQRVIDLLKEKGFEFRTMK